MRGPCQNSNCTFNMTKVCVLGNPPEECSNRPLVDEETGETDPILGEAAAPDRGEDEVGEDEGGRTEVRRAALGAPVLESPAELPTLPASRTLGIAQANAMMEERPTCMIGIVGLPGAGKTACLVSAYLLLAKGTLEGFSYADSDTLRAFEEIARASRTWVKGNPPEQMTNHTTLSNDREAGFLHLRIRRDDNDRLFDLLLPDLPGEWSKQLINSQDDKRLEFLRSSSVIWVMVDGRQFADPEKVAYARYRASLLIERLADLLGGHRPPILIVPTWQDAAEFPQAEVSLLSDTGAALGFEMEMAPIASFSWSAEVQPGRGVARLIERSVSAAASSSEFWPVTDAACDDRKIAAFRGRA